MASTKYTLPEGFSLGGVHCGLKQRHKRDLGLVVCHRPATAAGVYTQNRYAAAPVLLDRARTPSAAMRAVVVNSGNANACTGVTGLADARTMTELTGKRCGVDSDHVLVLSTGIIGERLNMSRVENGIERAAENLGSGPAEIQAFAESLLTTDDGVKLAQYGPGLLGFAKGAGMIAPNMATMLAVILTDASLTPQHAQRCLERAVQQSFNCISVDGHTSTNDTVLLIASGASGQKSESPRHQDEFQQEINDVCQDLARQIVADGEGATHVIEINVTGCQSRDDAITLARTVGTSPLVKTAIAGADPNWGRIISAIGFAAVDFEPDAVTLSLNNMLLFEKGAPVAFQAAEVSAGIRANPRTVIDLRMGDGPQSARFWASDLTAEYVRINTEYRT